MDFQGMSPEQALQAASKDLGLPDDFFDRQWAKESSRGKAMRSPAGARGHFQLMPKTQAAWESRLGRKLDPDNFADSLTMAHATMKENLAKFKDPVLATAAYNSGWEPSKWANPETTDYVATLWGADAVAKLGNVKAAPAKQNPLRVQEAQVGPRLIQPDAQAVLPGAPTMAQATQQLEDEARARDSASVTNLIGLKWEDNRENSLQWTLDNLSKPDGDPAFDYFANRERIEKLAKSYEEVEWLRENVRSEEQLTWAEAELNKRRDLDKVYAQAPGYKNILASLAVGVADPGGWIAGFGATKAFQVTRVGARALAAAGRTGAAVASLAAENAAGNIAWEVYQDAMGQVKTAADYTMAGVFGLGMTPLQARGVYRQAAEAALLRTADDVQLSAAERIKADIDAGISPADRARTEAAEVRRVVDEGTTVRSPKDSQDVFMPHDMADEVRAADGDGVELPPQKEAPPARAEPPQAPAENAQGDEPADVPTGTAFELTGQDADEFRAIELRSALDDLLADGEPARGTPEAAEVASIREELAAVQEKLRDYSPSNGYVRTPSGYIQFGMTQERQLADPAFSLRTALEHAKKVGDEVTAALADVLLKSGSKALDYVPVKYIRRNTAKDWEVSASAGKDWGGAYESVDGEVYISELGASVADPRRAALIVHEALHAIVRNTTRAFEKDPSLLSPIQRDAVEKLHKVFAAFKQDLKDNPKLYAQEAQFQLDYATKNLDEFMSQVFSHHVVRYRLSKMQGFGYATSALRDVVTAVLDLVFGKKRRKRDSALDDTMALIDTLVTSGGVLPKGFTLKPGIDISAAMASPQVRNAKSQQFSDRMYAWAEQWAQANPVDQGRLKVLAARAEKGGVVRDYALSDGLKLASSANPIVRMVAGLIVETTTGAAGRRSTAATRKVMLHNKLLGNLVPDFDAAYIDYRRRVGGGTWEDLMHGKHSREFNRLVYEEIVTRRYGGTSTSDGAVLAAANSVEQSMQRSLDAQKAASTLGSGYLPPDSKGYVPQSLRGEALAAASRAELNELADHMASHWQNIYGWSKDFSDTFSDYYLRRALERANGKQGVDFVALESPTAAVRDTLEMMRLEARSLDSRARAELDRVGAQPQNKKRLDVDLLATLPSGKRVLDYYETDVLNLTRQHANRVSGAVALAEANILGQRGINNIMEAVYRAPPELRASPDETAAMERVFAEFMGMPWHGEVRSNTALQLSALTRLQRMGGMGFTQLAEFGNITHQLGLTAALKGVAMLPKMLGEIGRIRKGQNVRNYWLSGVEQAMGSEFGLEPFRTIGRLDPPDELLRHYAKGSGLLERALAAGNFAQSKLSFFRAALAAQHRATAEMVVKRAAEYIKKGDAKSRRYLNDMGFTPELIAELRPDIDKALGPNFFDVTAFSNQKAQADFLAAVHRGVSQIIQDTFIGERGAWAHNDYAKLLLQFRTFSLTAIEKQWGRTKAIEGGGMVGTAAAAGWLLGQMVFTLPIFLARAEVYAAGREDRDEYLKKVREPAALIQGVLNYTALGGMSSDFLDLLIGTAGAVDPELKTTLGGRSTQGGVAGMVPAIGSIDQGVRAGKQFLGSVGQGEPDLYPLLRQLPLSNLPGVANIINLTKQD